MKADDWTLIEVFNSLGSSNAEIDSCLGMLKNNTLAFQHNLVFHTQMIFIHFSAMSRKQKKCFDKKIRQSTTNVSDRKLEEIGTYQR